ncbi:DeoR family transcriptional regulator [Liquorilactobacillus vini DSM 20605]|uniref:DeoR family transcriptional regulator n=1 Tax=Liquorilactobacillus vini DSM 20605 TaxID=1133569 RepID=A0A0R2C8J2_9LACO|nr:DeoR family transcriptional regulator [Liquorilactobacillus vini DSM 20605]
MQILEQQGFLIRIHGGAKLKRSLQSEPDMAGKAFENVQQKMEIAKYTATLVEKEDVIYLDAGSSTLAMIPYLDNNLQLTVVTNGVMHASELADRNIKTILIGGELKNTTKAIIGIGTIKELLKYRFNKVFLGINGISSKYGYTTPDPDEAELKITAGQQGEQRFVLADSSKFGQVSFVRVAKLNWATIITNKLPHVIFNKYNSLTEIREVPVIV